MGEDSVSGAGHGSSGRRTGQGYLNGRSTSDEHEEDDDDRDILSDSDKDESPSDRSSAVPAGQRTVLLRGLPEWATHQEIIEVIRGGALLHIYLRGREHIVNVSFVEGSSAQESFNYAKSHGIYVAGKRVSKPFTYLPANGTRSKLSGETANSTSPHM